MDPGVCILGIETSCDETAAAVVRSGEQLLSNTVFSTVPGAPVFVGKAPSYRSKNEKLGIDLNIKNHNALQSTFAFDC